MHAMKAHPGCSGYPAQSPARHMQQVSCAHWWRRGLLWGGALLAILFATFVFAPLAHHSDAASAFTQTCRNAPVEDKALACNGQDPILNNCISGATTLDPTPIFNAAHQQIGRLEIRYSAVCGTYWGRAFTSLPNVYLALAIRELLTNPGGQYEGPAPEIYGNMFYGFQPGISVQVVGTTDRTPPNVYIPGAHG